MRLTPADELELRWYCHEADGELGLRSPIGAMLERAAARQLFDMGGYPGNPEMERAIAAARRADRVRDRLRRMGNQASAVLRAAYCAEQLPGLGTLDRLGAVAPMTSAARGAYDRHRVKLADVSAAHARWHAEQVAGGKLPRARTSTIARWLGTRVRVDEVLRAAVLAEADRMLSEAVRKWENAKNRRARSC